MTQAVPTDGFNVAPGNGPAIQPPNAQPGFVPPNAQQNAEPQAPAQRVNQPDAGLSAAIAAMTAALQANKAPEPATVPEVVGGLNEYDVNSIDDPAIKGMATVLKNAASGIDLDRAIGKAIEYGDIGLIDSAYLREAGGANADQLVAIAQGLVQTIEAKSQEVTAKVYALAGSEDSWNASTAVFNSQAPAELKTVVSTMLDSKRPDLVQAAAKMVVEFGKSSGQVPQVGRNVQSGLAAVPSAMALDKAGFQEELHKLNPNARDFEQKRSELFARRQMGKRMGK